MEELAEAIIWKCNQIRAYGQYGLIALNAIELADERPSSPIRKHLDLVGELLPDSYLYGQHITEPWYKYVVLSNNQALLGMMAEMEAFLGEALKKVPLRDTMDEARRRKLRQSVIKGAADDLREILADDTACATTWKIYLEAKLRRNAGVHAGWRPDGGYQAGIERLGLAPVSSEYLYPDYNYLIDLASVLVTIIGEVGQRIQELIRDDAAVR